MVDPIMNLISETHDFCERREYAFNIISEYKIITHLANDQNYPFKYIYMYLIFPSKYKQDLISLSVSVLSLKTIHILGTN